MAGRDQYGSLQAPARLGVALSLTPMSRSSPRRGKHAHRSLAFYLGLFGLVILLPALVFGGFLIWQFTMISRDATERRAFDMAEALIQDVDQGIVEMVTALRILARSPELDRRDLEALHERVQAALWATHLHVVLIDRDLQQLLNTRVDFGTPLGRTSDPETARRAIETKEVVVSNLFYDEVAGKHVFNVVLPVVRDGEVVYLLSMTRNADTLVDMLRKQRLPSGWMATILDRSGIVIVRSRDHGDFIAKPSPLAAITGLDEDAVRTTIQRQGDGTQVLYAIGRSSVSGWLLFASVPLTVVEAPLRDSWTMFAIVGGILVGFSLLFVVLIAHRMGASMQSLANDAEKLGRGEAVEPRSFAMRETNDLSKALHNAYQELRARTVALRESEEHLRLSTEAAELGTWERNLETGEIKTSSEYRRMLGFPEEAVLSSIDELRETVHPEDRESIRAGIDNLIATGEPYEAEYRIELPDSRERWILSRGRLAADEESGRRRILGVAMDITERKEREAHVAFLMREMSHRAKNLLSVIQAMASQTGRTSASLEAFQHRFSERLQSLARSNDLLVHENWQGAPVETLVRSQLAAFLDIDGAQVEISGEPFSLSAQATQTLGLALHELATNAAKYGALSVPEGRVRIDWRVERRNDTRWFLFKWVESDGPPVEGPSHRGFGSIVIETLVRRALKAGIELEFAPSGLRWSLEAPVSAIVGGASGTAAAG